MDIFFHLVSNHFRQRLFLQTLFVNEMNCQNHESSS